MRMRLMAGGVVMDDLFVSRIMNNDVIGWLGSPSRNLYMQYMNSIAGARSPRIVSSDSCESRFLKEASSFLNLMRFMAMITAKTESV